MKGDRYEVSVFNHGTNHVYWRIWDNDQSQYATGRHGVMLRFETSDSAMDKCEELNGR